MPFCKIASCPEYVLKCVSERQQRQAYICVTGLPYGDNCGYWSQVITNSAATKWGNEALEKSGHIAGKPLGGIPPLTKRMTLSEASPHCNPSTLHIDLILTIENPQPTDEGTYWLYKYGDSEYNGKFYLWDMEGSHHYDPNASETVISQEEIMQVVEGEGISGYADPNALQQVQFEAGSQSRNHWLEHAIYKAQSLNQSDCFVCSMARPYVGTVPFPVNENSLECLPSLYKRSGSEGTVCSILADQFPIITKKPMAPDHIQFLDGNYTCYDSKSEGERDFGSFKEGICSHILDVDAQNMTQGRADTAWLCGDGSMHWWMTGTWKGQCTPIVFIMPYSLIPMGDALYTDNPLPVSTRELKAKLNTRVKRELHASIDPHVYLDAFGFPRGVPDEFRGRSEVKAAFESLFPMYSITKKRSLD